METTPEFNNHILTDQERRQFTIIADETVQLFDIFSIIGKVINNSRHFIFTEKK